VLFAFKPVLPGELEREIWSEDGSRAAELHVQWLRESMNEIMPPHLVAEGVTSVSGR